MHYNDIQLKQALAKMLPETLLWDNGTSPHNTDREPDDAWGLCWDSGNPVLDTELLHLCWLVEETLTPTKLSDCADFIYKFRTPRSDSPHPDYHASWQQRTIALAKVKGIEIV